MTRLQDDLLFPLDKFASEEADTPSRPEAIRRILRDWLIGNGYIRIEDDEKS
jgi:metal-responsive CopG/Arc/MetJ family transcriptional regulator